jgi:hypothetical protein
MLSRRGKKPKKSARPNWLAGILTKRNRDIDPFAELAMADIRKAFENLNGDCPPVLSLEQAAKIANLAPSTLKRKVSERSFKKSVKRGKPLLFWRDLFVKELMK